MNILPVIEGWQKPKKNWQPGDGIMAGDLNRIEGNIDELRIRVLSSVTIGGICPYDALSGGRAYLLGLTTVHVSEFLRIHFRAVGDFANGAEKIAFVSFHKSAPSFSVGDSGGIFTQYSTLKNSSIYYFDFTTEMGYMRVSLDELGLTKPSAIVACCGVAHTEPYISDFTPFKGSVMATFIEEQGA